MDSFSSGPFSTLSSTFGGLLKTLYAPRGLRSLLLPNVVERPCIQPQETRAVIERRKKDDFKEEVTAVPVWAGYEHLWLPSAPLSDLAPPDVHVHREVLSESLVEVGDGISTELFWPPGFPSISRALLSLPIFLLPYLNFPMGRGEELIKVVPCSGKEKCV